MFEIISELKMVVEAIESLDQTVSRLDQQELDCQTGWSLVIWGGTGHGQAGPGIQGQAEEAGGGGLQHYQDIRYGTLSWDGGGRGWSHG